MKLKSKLLLALLATSSAAFAQTAPAAPEVTYNVGVVSQYRYRGLAQTKGQPALQGGVDYANASGYYLGAWASQIKWIEDSSGNPSGSTYGGSTELDTYGGYKFNSAGADYDIGFLRYNYLGNSLGNSTAYTNASTNEAYFGITAGNFSFKYSNSLGNLFGYLNSKNSSYIEFALNYDLGSGTTLTPHIGRQTIQGSGNVSYTDGSLTVAKDLGAGLTVTGSAIVTNAKSSFFTSNSSGYTTGKSAVVVGLKYGF